MNEIRLMHLIQMRILTSIQRALGGLAVQEQKDMSAIKDSVASLRAEVEAEKGQEASTLALLTSLLQRIADANANAADANQAVTDVNALVSEMQANIAPLVAAVAANPTSPSPSPTL